MAKIPLVDIVSTTVKLLSTDKVQKSLFGRYSDGSSRNLVDCLNDEIISPRDRERYLKKKKKKKRKKAKIKL